jgi:hypothetical protein
MNTVLTRLSPTRFSCPKNEHVRRLIALTFPFPKLKIQLFKQQFIETVAALYRYLKL